MPNSGLIRKQSMLNSLFKEHLEYVELVEKRHVIFIMDLGVEHPVIFHGIEHAQRKSI